MVCSRSKAPQHLQLPRYQHEAAREIIDFDASKWSPINKPGRAASTRPNWGLIYFMEINPLFFPHVERSFRRIPSDRLMPSFPMERANSAMDYLSRICFNQSGWTRPDGSAVGMEIDTFYAHHGHGHEEWLFRSEWQIDGWQYGFLQGVNNSRTRVQGSEEQNDVTLFTLTPEGRRYVAVIRDLECLSFEQSDAVFAEFEERGWISQMQQEVEDAGGENAGIASYEWLNVRFRLAQVEWFPPQSFAEASDYIHNLKRYQMNTALTGVAVPKPARQTYKRKPSVGELSTQSYHRRGSAGRECTPEHKMMQNLLACQLRKEFPQSKIFVEYNFVDVMLENDDERVLYEIKSDLSARTVMRLAMGQLLEYAFRAPIDDTRGLRLVMVGRVALDEVDRAFLNYLRTRFELPLEYRVLKLP
jgi:hypothetical protein